jgi:SAM-dependent methyltransferase
MAADFAGWTAEQYAVYRRDVPDEVVTKLIEHSGLRRTDRVLDLGVGTGQLLLPLVRRLGPGIGLDLEPDLLRLLRDRARAERADIVALLAAAEDLPVVGTVMGEGSVSLVTMANALHWMDASEVFTQAHRLLRPGGIAVVSHGLPLWMTDTPWARALNRYLQEWLGQPTGWMCGLDDATRDERIRPLQAAGFQDVTVLRHTHQAVPAPKYVVGHLYSAMSAQDVPVDRWAAFEQGVLDILREHERRTGLIEDVPVVTVAAHVHR